MATVITHTTHCTAPVETAFAYTANYRNVGNWLFGVKQFTPVGEKDYGLGAIFDADVHVGVSIKSRIEVDEFEENALMSFDTIKGFDTKSRWTFEPTPEGTAITAVVELTFPGGIAGRAMEKIVKPLLGLTVNKSAEHLKRDIEAAAAAA